MPDLPDSTAPPTDDQLAEDSHRLRERLLTLLAGAALGLACLAVAFCGYAFNKPILRGDVDDQPFPIQEHRVEWSRWSALCAGLALALAIPRRSTPAPDAAGPAPPQASPASRAWRRSCSGSCFWCGGGDNE